MKAGDQGSQEAGTGTSLGPEVAAWSGMLSPLSQRDPTRFVKTDSRSLPHKVKIRISGIGPQKLPCKQIPLLGANVTDTVCVEEKGRELEDRTLTLGLEQTGMVPQANHLPSLGLNSF